MNNKTQHKKTYVSYRIYNLFGILFTILLSFTLTACKQANNSDNSPKVGKSEIISVPVVIPTDKQQIVAIAVDLNHNNQASQTSILDGQDAVLLYDAKGTELAKPNQPQLLYFSRKALLKLIDPDGVGRIDYLNPNFQRLVLLTYYDHGQKRQLIPLYNSGIRAIFISEKIIGPVPNNGTNTFTNNANRVVMSDGSIRYLIDIDIDRKYLAGIAAIVPEPEPEPEVE